MLLKADKALTFCDCWLLALSLWYTKKVDIFFFYIPSSWLFWAKADLRTIPDSLQKFRIEIIIISILHQYMSISYHCINLGSIYPWKAMRLKIKACVQGYRDKYNIIDCGYKKRTFFKVHDQFSSCTRQHYKFLEMVLC